MLRCYPTQTENTMKQVALYLRSSKNRSAVSIDAQRRELQELATRNGWIVCKEFSDVVESGKTEFRAGIQQVMREIKEPERRRGWTALLMTDTSRLSRRRFFAQLFKHEAQKAGVEIVYSKIPETDPIAEVILQSVLEAMDEVHSLMSRKKGSAGMAENVKKGYRTGGRAPRGYSLVEVETGKTREGSPIKKSVLKPNADAPKVAKYLKSRARGISRTRAIKDAGITWSTTGLIGMEHNALTYAGMLVWNRHSRKGEQHRYRPREEWVIQRDAHQALIDEDEAEAILYQINNSKIGEAASQAKAGNSRYLLVGFAVTPSGQSWVGYGKKYYRIKPVEETKGRYVSMADLDAAVKRQIVRDLSGPDLARDLARSAKKERKAADEEADGIAIEIVRLEAQISKTMDMAASLDDPAIVLKKVNELSAKNKSLEEEIARAERDRMREEVIDTVDEEKIAALLSDLSGDLESLSFGRWRELLFALVSKVILGPISLECKIVYRLPKKDGSLNGASPRVRQGWVAHRDVSL